MTVPHRDDAWSVELASLRAWPALEEERLGDWRLRSSEGFSKRANSVQALGDPGLTVDDAIDQAEAWYAERRRPCLFRITPLTDDAVDDALERRSYGAFERTHVLTRDAEGLAGAGREGVGPERTDLTSADLHDWLREYARLTGAPAAPAPLGRIVAAIGPQALLAVLRRGPSRRVVACGLAVLDGPWLGLFDLVVDVEERGKGLGRALVGRLAAWGIEGGARRVYLQVTQDNEPALRLYRRLGFESLYDYAYRTPSA